MQARDFYRAVRTLSWERAQKYAERANQSMLDCHIDTLREARYWIAQVGHESASFYYTEEIASGAAYEGRRDLGNVRPGDGRRFKGRDWIQITGRYNYTNLSRDVKIDFVGHPDWLSQEKYIGTGVAWYWRTRNLNQYAQGTGDFRGITRRINGGYNGLADRIARMYYAKRAGQGILPDKPDPLRILTVGERLAVEGLRHERKRASEAGWGSGEDRRSPKFKATYWKAKIRGVYMPAIRAAARASGWSKANRRERYAILKDAYGPLS